MGFHYVLNVVGQKTSVTKQTPSGSELTSYTYNARGFLKSVTYPDGKQVTYTYDSLGNRLSTTTMQGASTTVVKLRLRQGQPAAQGRAARFSPMTQTAILTPAIVAGPVTDHVYSFDVRNLLTRSGRWDQAR